jgi:hypothetical protein
MNIFKTIILAAAVIAVGGAHAASAQMMNPYYHPTPYHPIPVQPVPYTPPLQYQVPAPPVQPYFQPNQPLVVVPFNAFGSTIR